jgi:KaiC protein
MLYRCIAPEWATKADPGLQKVAEGEFRDEFLTQLNNQGYNIYWLPNGPSGPIIGTADGTHIDCFSYVFVDMDLKEGKYDSKQAFIDKVNSSYPKPSFIVDSGNGIHAYWLVTDLDAKSYLRLTRRFMRALHTDEAVGKLFQLMRKPDTFNTKEKDNYKLCHVVESTDHEYTCEELDKALPSITKEDEEYCVRHYDQTHSVQKTIVPLAMPFKFTRLMKAKDEIKTLYAGAGQDRSGDDFRLAHLLFAEGFTRIEAASVLMNCRKTMDRSIPHRQTYALNMVDKIWTFENSPPEDQKLSKSVKDILSKGISVRGTKFPCSPLFDGTENGFRLTQVLALVGGAGCGKTTVALNFFWHFVKKNPDYIHVFCSLEQTENEIALRWDKICQGNSTLHDKVHILGNYNEDGSYRRLSLGQIEDYIVELETQTGKKVGCVVVDHIGVLDKKTKEGENQGLMDICHAMKSFAVRTNTFLVMQSQTTREKSGIGDLELDKTAGYGTSMLEWYADFLVTIWQPLKRVYDQNPEMTCIAYKFCKIRNKHTVKDNIKEDQVFCLMFNIETEQLRSMTEAEEFTYTVLDRMASNIRNKDRKRETTRLTHISWETEDGTS